MKIEDKTTKSCQLFKVSMTNPTTLKNPKGSSKGQVKKRRDRGAKVNRNIRAAGIAKHRAETLGLKRA